MFCSLAVSPVKNCFARVFPKTTGSTASKWLGFGRSDKWICKFQTQRISLLVMVISIAFYLKRLVTTRCRTQVTFLSPKGRVPRVPRWYLTSPTCKNSRSPTFLNSVMMLPSGFERIVCSTFSRPLTWYEIIFTYKAYILKEIKQPKG